MATESLVVELDAKTQKLDAKLKATDARLKDLEGQTKRNDLALASMAKGGLKVVGALASAAAAISTMVLMSARSTKELALLSSQAKLTTGEFKSLAFATKQYGIDAENIADISKDMSDKIGEFAKVGTGAFQDFADVANLSKDDAMAVASEFQHMSSDQVLGRMVSMMEEAGATQSQMVFAMESMGNEASRLIPLFKDQSVELKTLRSAYDDINASMQINEEQQRELTELATNWDMLTSALGNSATAISATLAPILNDFINDVIKIVPQATKVLNDFVFTFTPKGAEVEALENQISGLNEQISELTAKNEAWADSNSDLPITTWIGSDEDKQKLDSLIAQVDQLIQKRNELLNPPKVETPKGGEIGGEVGGGTTGNFALTDEQFNDQVSLFTEQSESFNSLALQIQTDGAQAEIDLNKWKLDEIYKQGVAARKRKEAFDKQMQKFEELRTLGNAKKIIGALGSINQQFFDDNKALNQGLIVADTAATVMSEYKTGGWPAAIAAGLTGAAQLAALNSASVGGGSVSSVSGGGASAAPIDVAPSPEIDVNVGDVSTGAAGTLKLVLEDGTEIAEGLLEGQSDAESNGRGDLF